MEDFCLPGCSLLVVLWPLHSFNRKTYINVFQGENHRVCDKHTTGLFVDGGGDDVRIYGHIPSISIIGHFEGGILSAEKLAEVFVQHKHQLGNAWGKGKQRR